MRHHGFLFILHTAFVRSHKISETIDFLQFAITAIIHCLFIANIPSGLSAGGNFVK